MYSMLVNELNLWIGLFLLWGGEVRSFLSPGHIRLGNGPPIFDNGPHLSPWDVLSLETFCLLGRFVPWDVLSLGTFCPWDVLSLGRFVLGRFVCASSNVYIVLYMYIAQCLSCCTVGSHTQYTILYLPCCMCTLYIAHFCSVSSPRTHLGCSGANHSWELAKMPGP